MQKTLPECVTKLHLSLYYPLITRDKQVVFIQEIDAWRLADNMSIFLENIENRL